MTPSNKPMGKHIQFRNHWLPSYYHGYDEKATNSFEQKIEELEAGIEAYEGGSAPGLYYRSKGGKLLKVDRGYVVAEREDGTLEGRNPKTGISFVTSNSGFVTVETTIVPKGESNE